MCCGAGIHRFEIKAHTLPVLDALAILGRELIQHLVVDADSAAEVPDVALHPLLLGRLARHLDPPLDEGRGGALRAQALAVPLWQKSTVS